MSFSMKDIRKNSGRRLTGVIWAIRIGIHHGEAFAMSVPLGEDIHPGP